MLPIALQLYTVREEAQKDFTGTLEKVAEMGYEGVEFAGYGGLKASELKKVLDRTGLKAAGSHVGIELLKKDLNGVLEYSLEIGNRYIVCPGVPYKSKEDYIEMAKFFNEVGERCKEKGLIFCYHNHAHEFEIYDGEYGLDILFKNTDKESVKAEIDVYWVKYAGVDPLEYLKKFSGRLPLIHLKDMDGKDRSNTEIGNGIINFKKIVKVAEENGVEWLIVEQDECKRSPLESARISLENLKRILKEEL